MDRSTPGFPVHHQLRKLAQTHVHQVDDSIQPSHPLLSPSPPHSILPSIRVFSSESVFHIRWPKYWSFSFSISPSNEYSGLISFRMDWLDLLAVQGTLKSLSNTIVQKHQFFGAQLSLQSNFHIHTWVEKTALTKWTFVGKVMSLLFNMLSRLIIAFLPRSMHLLISWLQSPSAEILEPQKIVWHCFVSPSICHEVMGPDAMILVFWMLSFKPAFSLYSFTLIKRLFSYSSLSAITVVSSSYLRFLIFLQAILTPTCALSSPAFHIIYSAYKLKDNIQPWLTPFPIWNQSVVPCPVLTVASWPTYFLRGRSGGLVFPSL